MSNSSRIAIIPHRVAGSLTQPVVAYLSDRIRIVVGPFRQTTGKVEVFVERTTHEDSLGHPVWEEVDDSSTIRNLLAELAADRVVVD